MTCLCNLCPIGMTEGRGRGDERENSGEERKKEGKSTRNDICDVPSVLIIDFMVD